MDEEMVGVVVPLTAAQLAAVDRFQKDRQLPSREAAVAWLIDIAVESTTGSGRRYWDKPIRSGKDQATR